MPALAAVRAGIGRRAEETATKRLQMKRREDYRQEHFRPPTELELTFFRIVTRGFPEYEAQIERCEIADYDPDGWWQMRAIDGPPLIGAPLDGPSLEIRDPEWRYLEVLIWTTRQGLLDCLEILDTTEKGDTLGQADLIRVYLDAESEGRLKYDPYGRRRK
jgi:hypothetical protein